jgi:hypothetical protein
MEENHNNIAIDQQELQNQKLNEESKNSFSSFQAINYLK